MPFAWFERASSIENDVDDESTESAESDDESPESAENDDDFFYEAIVSKRKLETIYQFIHAMPEVFEPTPGAGEKKEAKCF